MKIAAFNVENLFSRPKAFSLQPADSTRIINAIAEINKLLDHPVYSAADKAQILALLQQLGLLKTDTGTNSLLRKLKGQLLKRPKTGDVTVVAHGRADWVGWVEHKVAAVNEVAMDNTARVMRDIGADVLAVVEAESRPALQLFADTVLRKIAGRNPYAHTMLIDGNDDRGIDVGLLTQSKYPIADMRSHVHDTAAGKVIFSRDCPEYCVHTPGGHRVWVLPNHFKSKFGGDTPAAKAKRKSQAVRVAEIYTALLAAGEQFVVILGDLNDTPTSDALAPLLSVSGLKDVSAHAAFSPGEFAGTGTFGTGSNSNKIDYLLLSPVLFGKVTAAGLFRKGAWPGSASNARWETYPELQREVHAASDHHAIWCEINLA